MRLLMLEECIIDVDLSIVLCDALPAQLLEFVQSEVFVPVGSNVAELLEEIGSKLLRS